MQMQVLFAMMLIGFFLWKKAWVNDTTYKQLSKIVVNILNPLLIINGVLGQRIDGKLSFIMQNIFLCAFFFIFLIVLSNVIVWIIKPKKENRYMYKLLALIQNSGFIGIPVITSVYGKESMIYIIFYILMTNILLYTYGLLLVKKTKQEGNKDSSDKKETSQWKSLFNSGVIASLIAILIFALQLDVAAPVVNFCNYMGNATIPLSMFIIGISIAKSNLKAIFCDLVTYKFIALRMIVIPLIAIPALKLFTINPVVFGVFALQLSMPVGSIIALIAKENNIDESCCTSTIVLSTLFSVVTIPLMGFIIF